MSEIDAFLKWLDAQATVTALAGIADDEIIPTWPETKSGLFNEYPQLTVGALRAFNASANQKGEWLPIETAPKDGRKVILILTPSKFPQVAYSNTWWMAGFSVENKPTHWMPLPEIP